MAKTRARKEEEVRTIAEHIDGSKGFVAFGWSGAGAERVNELRGKLQEAGSVMQVVKRSLLRRVLEGKHIPFEPKEFLGQTSLVYFPDDISGVAGTVYDFVQETEGELFGGFDTAAQEVMSGAYVSRLGQLPSRQVLLGQVVGGISAPLRALVYTLKAMSEKA